MHNNKDQKVYRFSLRHDILVCLFLVVAALAVYWQVQNHDFVNFDDDHYVYENQYVRKGLGLKSIVWAFSYASQEKTYWHPVAWLSHMLDCQLFGLKPGKHHLINLIFHIANTLLLFIAFRWMTGALWRSALVAMLFAIHPINVDTVAWVAERKNVLSTFFWMLTMLAYVHYSKQTAFHRYLLMVLAFVLGLMSKPMLVTLPCVLLLLDFWPLGRFPFSPLNNKKNEGSDKSEISGFQGSSPFVLVLEKIPLLALSVLSVIISSLSFQGQGKSIPMSVVPLKLRIANALVSYVKYIGKMTWPKDLAVLYPYPKTVPIWQAIGALAFLVVISALTIRSAKRAPCLITGWLWYLGTLVPVIGLVQVGLWPAMADRFAYVPFIGLFIIMAWGVPQLTAKWELNKKWPAVLATVVLAMLMKVTWEQVGYWKNSITLFEHNLKVTASHFIPYNNLGNALEKQGRTKEAVELYKRALKIKPDYALAHNNLALALEKQGRIDEAIEHYFHALRIKPDYSEANNNLALARYKQGRTQEAIELYLHALQVKPDYAKAHNNLALALEKQGRTEEAVRHYIEALRIKPDYAKAHNNLGNILSKQGRRDEAIKHYSKALQTDPNYAEAHNNIGVELAEAGRSDEAVHHYFEAFRINPGYVEAYMNLGSEMNRLGKIDEAIRHYQKALSLKPEFPEAIYLLAKLYISRGDYEKALSLYHKMIAFMPDNPIGYYNIACIYATQNKPEKSASWLKKAVARGLDDWNHIKTDKDLDNIRNSIPYKAFIKDH